MKMKLHKYMNTPSYLFPKAVRQVPAGTIQIEMPQFLEWSVKKHSFQIEIPHIRFFSCPIESNP
jgi:hypothetical protein